MEHQFQIYVPLLAALISAFLVGWINIWINHRNKVFGARKEYMTKGLFLVNRAVSMVFHPNQSNDLNLVLDEVRTIFALYANKKERLLEQAIAKGLRHPYASDSTLVASKTQEEVYDLVSELTNEIRQDLTTRIGIW